MVPAVSATAHISVLQANLWPFAGFAPVRPCTFSESSTPGVVFTRAEQR